MKYKNYICMQTPITSGRKKRSYFQEKDQKYHQNVDSRIAITIKVTKTNES